jgi:hypothetical protein
VAEVFSDELRERRYVIVDGVDGRTHYVELGLRNADDARLIRNTIIELRAREIAPRAVDRTIVRSRPAIMASTASAFMVPPIRAPQLNLSRLTSAGSRRCGGRAWPNGWPMGHGGSGRIISIARRVSRRRTGCSVRDRAVVAEPRGVAERRWRDMV